MFRLVLWTMLAGFVTPPQTSRGEDQAIAESGGARDASTARLAQEVRRYGWLAFSAPSERGDWDLFVCRPDGSDRRNLTRTPESHEVAAQFSRDGRRLLFRRLPVAETIDGNHYGTQGELMFASSDGSSPTALGEAGEFPWASWSPDGQQVACLSVKGIALVDVATRQVVRKLPRLGFFQQMTWSPDGRWLSGVSNSFGASWSVAILEVETAKAHAVSGADCCTPDWFPESNRLVYSKRPAGQSASDGNGWTQLWMADADGRNRRLVYGEDGRHIYGGQVSPDGQYVVFTGNVQAVADPRHGNTPMGLLRLADTPVIGGESGALLNLHPHAKREPVLVLPSGWEPCWTAAEIDHPSAPTH
jgi:Tol biopolymer transport system component